ncbi:MAG: DUF1499 domain-containing protein [Betaproteobacteria bacterium]|nr:DUF1499 domain-containing protein [Betaproteobacteria bacterium]
MGLFAGSRPEGLGFVDGHFKPPSWKPNCVSSTIEKSDRHYIEPIALGAGNWAKLVATVKAQPRAAVVTENPDYLYAEFTSAGMGYVDDVEFALDAKSGVIQVRSSSRLGISDRGVNRARIEKIREDFSRS